MTLLGLAEHAGVSGGRLNRPGLQDALRKIEAGDIDGIVVARVDRLSRSLLDFTTMIERSRKKGRQLVAVDLGVERAGPRGS